jgi:hypothetical protein
MNQAVSKGTKMPFNAFKQRLRAHESRSLNQAKTTGSWERSMNQAMIMGT